LTVCTVGDGSTTSIAQRSDGNAKILYDFGLRGSEKTNEKNISRWARISGRKDREDSKVEDVNLKILATDSSNHLEAAEDVYPDGGPRAWMMVSGVSDRWFLSFQCSPSTTGILCREC